MSQKELGSFSRSFEILEIEGEGHFASPAGIRLHDTETGKLTAKFMVLLDSEDDPAALEKLMDAFDQIPVGTEMLVKRGLGSERVTKQDDGSWAKPEMSKERNPAYTHLRGRAQPESGHEDQYPSLEQ